MPKARTLLRAKTTLWGRCILTVWTTFLTMLITISSLGSSKASSILHSRFRVSWVMSIWVHQASKLEPRQISTYSQERTAGDLEGDSSAEDWTQMEMRPTSLKQNMCLCTLKKVIWMLQAMCRLEDLFLWFGAWNPILNGAIQLRYSKTFRIQKWQLSFISRTRSLCTSNNTWSTSSIKKDLKRRLATNSLASTKNSRMEISTTLGLTSMENAKKWNGKIFQN